MDFMDFAPGRVGVGCYRSYNRSNRMNVRHLVPSVSRWLLSMGSLMFAAGLRSRFTRQA